MTCCKLYGNELVHKILEMLLKKRQAAGTVLHSSFSLDVMVFCDVRHGLTTLDLCFNLMPLFFQFPLPRNLNRLLPKSSINVIPIHITVK